MHEWAKSLSKGVSTHVLYLDFETIKPVLSFSSVSPEVFSKGVQLGQNTARERSIETAECQM